MADVGNILSGTASLIGTTLNGIFSGMNYQSQQQQNNFQKNQYWGQSSQLFDTLIEGSRGDYDSYLKAYEANLMNGDWTQRIDPQALMNMFTADREDSAIQRKVKDAKKAGVNPYYALGGSGSPSTSYSSSNSSVQNLVAPKFEQVDFAGLADALSNINIKSEQAKLLNAQTEKTLAETNKINVDAVLSGETINLTKEQQKKVRTEVDKILSDIKLNEVQTNKFIEEIGILQYDLLKSIELGVRYKDQLTTMSFALNKLDKIAGNLTSSEFQKDLLMTIGVAFIGGAVGIGGKAILGIARKYAGKFGDKAINLFNSIKGKFKKPSSESTNISDFHG